MAKNERNPRPSGDFRPDAAAERRQAKFAVPADDVIPFAPGVAVIPDDDPELTAASTEAIERFGEFLTRFEHRRKRDTFAVKVPFADDYGREYMWVVVTGMDGKYLTGTLDNSPAYVRSVSAGQKVRVPRKGLSDWLVVRDGVPHGGFTIRVVEARLRGANGEAA